MDFISVFKGRFYSEGAGEIFQLSVQFSVLLCVDFTFHQRSLSKTYLEEVFPELANVALQDIV